MESEVRNKSVGRHYSLHYVMHLDHEHMYDVKLKGNLLGALSDLNFNTTIAFTSKANRVSIGYIIVMMHVQHTVCVCVCVCICV